MPLIYDGVRIVDTNGDPASLTINSNLWTGTAWNAEVGFGDFEGGAAGSKGLAGSVMFALTDLNGNYYKMRSFGQDAQAGFTVFASGVCYVDPANSISRAKGNDGNLYVANKGYSVSASVTRTNDTAGYLANDVIGAATGSTAAITFTGIGPSGASILINSVELEIDAAAIISGETSYNLYLYSVTPPSALGDNAAFDLPAGDRASFVGKIALGTPVDEGSTLYIRTDGLKAQFKLTSANLFGYLVTVGAYTPTASRVHKITLHAEAR